MPSWWSRWGRTRPAFAPATAPHPEYLHEDRVVEVGPALITAYEIGPTRALDAPKYWIRGAVYDGDGALVPESQRYGGLSGDHVVAVDPVSAPVGDATELDGTWLYGGHWMAHFGHFVTETLPTLWPTGLPVDGLLFHPFVFGRRVPSADELELAALAGYPAPPTIIDKPLVVERLLVPTRPYAVNAAATPRAAQVWDRVASAAGQPMGGGRGIFLSRSKFHADHAQRAGRPHGRALANEEQLDRLMAQRGLEVVHPQTLSVLDQVRMARAASTLVAVSGSALHLSAFARPGARVVEIGDPRSPDGLPNQTVVDAAVGHQVAVLPHAGPDDSPTLDLDYLRAALDDLRV